MRTKDEFEMVTQLKEEGKNNSDISRITGIPRGTVKDWINNPPKHFIDDFKKESIKDILIENKDMHSTYSYLLGLYLGDGYINECERTFRMRIALDRKYNTLNEYAKSKMSDMFVGNKVGVVDCENHINLSVYNSQLPELIPQHGKGFKHERDVSLRKWQQGIIIPEELLKGLIHSDGCFYKESIKGKYTYERYAFSNKSADLHEIFKDMCKKVGVEFDFQYNGNGVWQTRVSKKKSVEKLKMLIGTKYLPL